MREVNGLKHQPTSTPGCRYAKMIYHRWGAQRPLPAACRACQAEAPEYDALIASGAITTPGAPFATKRRIKARGVYANKASRLTRSQCGQTEYFQSITARASESIAAATDLGSACYEKKRPARRGAQRAIVIFHSWEAEALRNRRESANAGLAIEPGKAARRIIVAVLDFCR